MVSRVVCHYPWTSMYISPSGDVRHCCNTNLRSLGNIAVNSIDEVWNGSFYREVREKIAESNFDGAYCNPICPGLRSGQGYPWPDACNGNGVGIVWENESKAKENFQKNKPYANHFPMFLQLEFSNRCNLRCIMCFYDFTPPYKFIPDVAVKRLLSIAPYARTVALMGGEVFLNKQDLTFIDSFQPNQETVMGFITNGTLLNRSMVERLLKFKKAWFQISIDATEAEPYRAIRSLGNWPEVDSNIKNLAKTAEELRSGAYSWEIQLAYVVMATNFSNLPHAVQYAVDLGVDIGFHPLRGFHLFDENIYVYKKPFKKLENPNEVFSRAYQILETHKDSYPYYKNVRQCLNDVERQLRSKKIAVPPRFIINLLLRLFGWKKSHKNHGLSPALRKVGHLIEIYYNLRTGKTTLRNTLSYVWLKLRG